MHPSELQLGDIIFFHTTQGVPEHVAMYTGDIDGKPYVTHSVTNNTPGIHTTILKGLGHLDVFRHKDPELGKKAAQRILQWAQYRIPYDYRRAEWMRNINTIIKQSAISRKQDPTQELLAFMRQESKNKFYERIKFAARRDTCPVKIIDGQKPRGFTCVQAVILAYQVEEIAAYVKPLAEIQIELAALSETTEAIKEIWISDKHCPDEVISTYDLPDSYIDYCTVLRDAEEFSDFCFNDKRRTPTHPHYHPSLVAWRYDLAPSIDEFRKNFVSCLELPAKICYTEALLAYLIENQQAWMNMGSLHSDVLPTTFSAQEKQLHHKRSSENVLQIEANIAMIRLERRVSSASASSCNSPRISDLKCFEHISFDQADSPGQLFFTGKADAASLSSPRLSSMSGTKSPLVDKMFPRLGS